MSQWILTIALLLATGVLAGLVLPGEMQAESVKPGAALEASPGAAGGENQVHRLRMTATQLERLSREPLPREWTADVVAWAQKYNRWLRVNSARLKDLSLRWEGRLDRSVGRAGQIEEINRSFRLQRRQIARQMKQENFQFHAQCEPLQSRAERVNSLLKHLE